MKKLALILGLTSLFSQPVIANADLANRVIHSSYKTQSADSYFYQGKAAMQSHNYKQARDYFDKVCEAGAGPNNTHYFEAVDMISMGGKDILFKKEMQFYKTQVNESTTRLAYMNVDLKNNTKYPEGSQARKDLEKNRADLIRKIDELKHNICDSLTMRNWPCSEK
jgi:hypothetical protein